jgi:DNA-binding GntR family transcriptional regulator
MLKGTAMINLGAQHENLDQKAYQILKNMIMERQLLPGEKIPQERLAQELGISRTPLVSALKFLEQEKLVEAKPRRGYFVRLFTKKDLVSIFELREVLEGLAARRAAQRINPADAKKISGFFQSFSDASEITDMKAYAQEDRRFHWFIIETGAKEFLRSILETYNIMSLSYQSHSSEGLVRPPNETIPEHRAIIEAIIRRESDAAENLMRQHLRRSMNAVKDEIEKEA